MTDEQRIVKELENIKRKLDVLQRIEKTGWHPASELPPVDESGNSAELIAITCDNNLMKVYFHYESEEHNFWVESDDWNKQVKYGVNVKWWCYPPKED